MILTERIEHLERLESLLTARGVTACVLRGGMGVKEKRAKLAVYQAPENGDVPVRQVLLATGKYLGEGFDDARLDTLFLAFPVSWRGTLAQYAGRLHRRNATKERVIIYDYADIRDPVLAAMYRRRCADYRAIG